MARRPIRARPRCSSAMPPGGSPTATAVVRFTDSLVRGFGFPLAPPGALRAAGLLLFDLLRPVKHEFARRTMGLAGRQPRLVRGLSLLDRP